MGYCSICGEVTSKNFVCDYCKEEEGGMGLIESAEEQEDIYKRELEGIVKCDGCGLEDYYRYQNDLVNRIKLPEGWNEIMEEEDINLYCISCSGEKSREKLKRMIQEGRM